ncbi:hypothetical protein CRUP_021858 [Coryphaenoides rupestris]|nr:hypothetical protein CRUP_021858 [Coryphaenoides rupestris]
MASRVWAKGGHAIPEVTGDSYEVVVDHSFFTESVSCEVTNTLGSTNISRNVDVYCKPPRRSLCPFHRPTPSTRPTPESRVAI